MRKWPCTSLCSLCWVSHCFRRKCWCLQNLVLMFHFKSTIKSQCVLFKWQCFSYVYPDPVNIYACSIYHFVLMCEYLSYVYKRHKRKTYIWPCEIVTLIATLAHMLQYYMKSIKCGMFGSAVDIHILAVSQEQHLLFWETQIQVSWP